MYGLKIHSYRSNLVPKALFPGLGKVPWGRGCYRRHRTKKSDGGARREVREPEKIKVEDYVGEGESPGGSTSLYKPRMYVPPQRVGFLRRFGLKTGIDFPYFGLEG